MTTEEHNKLIASATCICGAEYNALDHPLEYRRVTSATLPIKGQLGVNTLREAADWLRAGAPGRALEVIERLIGKSKPALATLIESHLAEFDKRRLNDPACQGAPLSVSDREVLASQIVAIVEKNK